MPFQIVDEPVLLGQPRQDAFHGGVAGGVVVVTIVRSLPVTELLDPDPGDLIQACEPHAGEAPAVGDHP